MTSGFVHLHVHTEFSMLDGLAKTEKLFTEAARLGQHAVAMTDHGNMFGAYDFYHQALKAGVKPILGLEAYVAPESRHKKKPVFFGDQKGGSGDDVSGKGAYTHMTLWAKNSTGLRNLLRMSTEAQFTGFWKKPRIDKDLLAEHTDGLMGTTGCPGGEVPTRLRLGQWDKALEAAEEYRAMFAPGDFYVELMDHGIPMEGQLRPQLLKLADELSLPTVVTNDSHYVTQDQSSDHAALLCVQTGKTFSDEDRFKFDGDGYYLKSSEEMREFWDEAAPGACDRTMEIAAKVEGYDEVFAYKDRMPRVQVPDGTTEEQMLRDEVEAYIPERFPDGISQEYRDRITYELDVICDKGYASYFLVVGDAVRWVKARGGIVGPGRGSATGAMVSYILQIIDLDPIRHALIFERFLNPERDSPPDIDLDFDDASRDAVMRYVADKYGQENVAQVLTFGTIKTKNALKDAARVHFGQPGFSLAERMSKALPAPDGGNDIPLGGIVDPNHERYPEAAEFRSLIENDTEAKRVFDTARGLEGLVRNTGVHACATILSAEPLSEVVPLWMREDGAIITGWDYGPCESIGLLKMDFLGIKTLTVVNDAIAAVKNNHGVDIDLTTLELDDAATYELLSTGNALGVFQLDGNGARQLLKQIAPTHFGDISAALALNRPGPLAAGAHTAYAERSNGREKIRPIHPELEQALEPILSETYHLLVYQEQVMAITQQLAGYSLGQADKFRKAMGKKDASVLAKEKEKFFTGMVNNGFSQEATQTLWDVIEPFSGYAFNKSHTAGYGLVSYWCAYLKAHYPAEFMAAQLTTYAHDKDKTAVYLAECRRMGLRVLPPDVNESGHQFTATGAGTIRFGLAAIRNIGATPAQAILDTRDEHGPFTSFEDFLQAIPRKVLSKRLVESLIKAGAFDSLGVPRQALTAVHEEAVEAVSALKKHEDEGQFDLFGDSGGGDAADASASPLAHLTFGSEEWPRKQLLAYEREMLGLYVSAHPLDGAGSILRKHVDKPIAAVADEAAHDSEVTVAGLITSVTHKVNRQGQPWAIVVVEDRETSVEALFFPKSYEMFGAELTTDTAVTVSGRAKRRDDESLSVFASTLRQIDISSAEHSPDDGPTETEEPPFVLRVDSTVINEDSVAELRSALNAHPGDTPVYVRIGDTTMYLPHHQVEVTNALYGELKGLRGVGVHRPALEAVA